jgi:hypothetical protein
MSKKLTSVKVAAAIFAAVTEYNEACDKVESLAQLVNTPIDDMTAEQKTAFDALPDKAREWHARLHQTVIVVKQMQDQRYAAVERITTLNAEIAAVREKHGFSKLDDLQASALEYALNCSENAILAGRDPNTETEAWDELRTTLIEVAKKRAECAEELHPLMAAKKRADGEGKAAVAEVGQALDIRERQKGFTLASTEYGMLVRERNIAKERLESFQLTAAAARQIVAAAREGRLVAV